MRVALSIMLMQECCNPVLANSFVNGKMNQGGCASNLLHSSAVRYGTRLRLVKYLAISNIGWDGTGQK